MKKLEKLNSKLFEEFKMDEVGSLASVVGGIKCKTMLDGAPHYDDYQFNTTPRSNDITIGTSYACDGTLYTDDKNCPAGGSAGTGLMAYSEQDIMPIDYYEDFLFTENSSNIND